MSPRKSVQQELTREMIMDAARDLFIDKGYQHISMRQIAKKLGYSHGAIYYHFQNKAELFYALVEDHFNMLELELKMIMEEPLDPKEKLRRILLGFIRFGLTHQSHYEIMFLIKDEEVRNFINQEPSKTYEVFANSVQSLCDKSVTIQEIWSIFLSLHGFVTHYLRHIVDYEDVKEMAKLHVEFILKNFSNEK
ncbi:TetR/AcrR family transcriptional regulator [Lederbergia galactosidilytica]|uniref:TetR family transcriptional regulator n=1 Tax=Lederbergia galactosidilytica TaxID=217031 RepID=A0A0Q9XZB7_9BACI|nr:TetR/AcrR family transcriptional regulator [Lederbergia galactosidilytica]KRG14079.1 TetR family transcriptional regulator [Lederbergia galactosidilytica]KRG16445.1 TetR family transcriptional regulator [Virgibacillus soli]MBP1914227.1 AcrR family transcriptional regulator [Lederbergia galactosidilytica]OAK67322.1 TetR family transcriptional regulator [Lederbergia galactosidilytica]